MRTQHILGDDLRNDANLIHNLLAQIESATSTVLQRMIIANDLFLYIFQHPGLVQQYERFRIIVIDKMYEIFEAAERQKVIADPEGGEVNEPLMYAATMLQTTIEQLSQQI